MDINTRAMAQDPMALTLRNDACSGNACKQMDKYKIHGGAQTSCPRFAGSYAQVACDALI